MNKKMLMLVATILNFFGFSGARAEDVEGAPYVCPERSSEGHVMVVRVHDMVSNTYSEPTSFSISTTDLMCFERTTENPYDEDTVPDDFIGRSVSGPSEPRNITVFNYEVRE